MNGYVYLGLGIACEVFSTSMLKASAGFSRVLPSVAFGVSLAASFYAVAQALTFFPLNVVYAVWAGLGTVLTSLVAFLVWKEPFNAWSGVGIALIVAGVVLLNLKGLGR